MHGQQVTGSTAFLAGVIDAVNAGNWQRGGGKGQRPKPVLSRQEPAERVGGAAMTEDELRRRLGGAFTDA